MSLFYTLYYPCEKIRDFAYDYLEHKLGPVVGLRFKLHLRGCPECQEYIRLYEMAANPEQFMATNPVPSEFMERTLQFMKREGFALEEEEDF